MSWGSRDLRLWLAGCAERMIAAAPELNELDAKLGDGDLGATLEKCGRLMQEGLSREFETPADVFKACAMACTRASGSSFGTLMAVAFMALAKETNGRTNLAPGEVESLLGGVIEALMARGKASLGDKTVLDSLEAIRIAVTGLTGGESLPETARTAARAALDAYRNKPNRAGRARMFAAKSIGLDDPGMVAVVRMIGRGGDPV